MHILPLTDSSVARWAINILQSFKCYIYARSPQALHRILQEEYAWTPTFFDITTLDNLINKNTPDQWRQSSFSVFANTVFECPPCWKGRIFSCHARPSRCALRHREYFVSVVYVFALRYIGAHKQLPGDVGAAAGAAAVEKERRLEERRLEEEEECLQRKEEERLRSRYFLPRPSFTLPPQTQSILCVCSLCFSLFAISARRGPETEEERAEEERLQHEEEERLQREEEERLQREEEDHLQREEDHLQREEEQRKEEERRRTLQEFEE